MDETGGQAGPAAQSRTEAHRLGTAMDWMADSVLVTDLRGTILYVNRAFEQLTGYAQAEVLGLNPRVLNSGRHDPLFFARMWQTILDGRTWRGQMVNRRRDGSLFTSAVTITPVRDDAGRTVEFMAFQRDVTAEQELRDRLSVALTLGAMGQLAAGVAHDVGNILTVVASFGDLLRDALPAEHPLADLGGQVLTAATSGAAMLRQITNLSRTSDAGPAALDLNAAIRELLPLINQLLGAAVELDLDLQPDLPCVTASPCAVQQLLLNLAINARDAMPEGGRLRVRTAREPDWVVCDVSDTGVGIPRELHERIFEPGFTTKPPGRGSGLGLPTVAGIIERAGGRIDVDSRRGVGTTMSVRLPVAAA